MKYEIFLQRSTKFFLQKILGLQYFGSCQNCKSSAKLVGEIHQKLWNKRALSTEEPCTCQYVTLLQSFHRGTLSIHWYLAQNLPFPCLSYLDALLRLPSLADSQTWLWTSNFMNECYNGRFAPEFSVSVLKETMVLDPDYVTEVRN